MDELENTMAESGDEDIGEVSAEKSDDTEESEDEVIDAPVKKKNYGSIPAAIVGGIIGVFVSLIVISICCGVTGGMRYFPYVLIPLCTCFGVVLLKGDKGICGFVITVLLTALGVFLAPSFGAAALYAIKHSISVLSVPLIAITMIGKSNFLTDISFSSAYVFPIVFAIIGLAAVWQIYLYYRTK